MDKTGDLLDITAAVAVGADKPFATTALTLRSPGPGELLVRVVACLLYTSDAADE